MIFIVIPVFNRITLTQACLQSLHIIKGIEFTIIVVDHGSTDGTSEMINKCFPEVILVKGNDSLWWAGATNLGIEKALNLSTSDKDFILTLNNDLEVEERYLYELLNVYDKNKPCLVGSTSVDIQFPERISFIGGKWNKYTAKHQRSVLTLCPYFEVKRKHEFVDADLLPGRGVLIPIKAFKQLGLYDELNFPHYNADDDFSLRCKKNGYKLLVATKAVVKSHINENGLSTIKANSFIQSLYHSFTSIKSPNRLSTRFIWAKKNTPFPRIYFCLDVARIVFSAIKLNLKK
jgi:GT2 family glycosyltransferase